MQISYPWADEAPTTIHKVNYATHSANILAHIALFEAGHLTLVKIVIFELMYGFPPTRGHMVEAEALIEIHNMIGSMASISLQTKLGSRAGRFSEFISNSNVVKCVWTSTSCTVHKSLRATALLESEEFKTHKSTVEQTLEEFAQIERLRRVWTTILHMTEFRLLCTKRGASGGDTRADGDEKAALVPVCII